jgi:hypothetical protein
MACVVCRDLPLPSVEEPAATVSSSRRPALVAGPESRRGRGSRRLRSGIPATIVPVYSRIIYRASVVSVR